MTSRQNAPSRSRLRHEGGASFGFSTVAALLLTNAHLVLLQAAAPYKQASTAFVAVATSLTLACTLVAALLIKQYAELPADMVLDFFGFESPFPLSVIILTFNFGIVLLALGLFAFQVPPLTSCDL